MSGSALPRESPPTGMLVHMYARALAVTALSYAVLHHLGSLPSGLGDAPTETRWADWLDLAVPWLVLAPAAVTMWAAQPRPSGWVLFSAGALAYTSGHGIHLAANSIGNAEPGETAHLWDEPVGHHLWFAGVALVVLAIAKTMVDREPAHPASFLLALAVGLTWATNGIGGETEIFSLAVSLVAVAFGLRHRRDLAGLLAVTFLPAALLLVAALLEIV